MIETPLGIEVKSRITAERICGCTQDEPFSLTFTYLYHRDTDYTYGILLKTPTKARKDQIATAAAFVRGAVAMSR